MIVVKFGKDGQEYLLRYSSEKDYAEEILSAMTGISRDKLEILTDAEFEMYEVAAKALQDMPLSVGPAPLKPKLEVVK